MTTKEVDSVLWCGMLFLHVMRELQYKLSMLFFITLLVTMVCAKTFIQCR